MTFLGYQASRDASIASTTVLTNGTAIGKNARVAQSNTIILGGTGADAVNVGIGTTAPETKLQIGTAVGFGPTNDALGDLVGATGLVFPSPAGFNYLGSTIVSKATGSYGGNLLFGTKADNGNELKERMRIDSAGNVGIGTTAPGIGTIGVDSILTVKGSAYYERWNLPAYADGASQAVGYLNFVQTTNNATYKNIASIASYIHGGTAVKRGGELRFYTQADNTAGQSQRMIIDKDGNVGIGTATPDAKLDVSAGNIDIDNTTNANQFGIITKNGGTRFIHNFNYGNNGTVTTSGYNTFVGENAGNLTMGSTATVA